LHGHSPSYRRKGWKANNVKHGKSNPLSYLSRDLVEKDVSRTHQKGGARVDDPLRTFPIVPRADHDPSSSKKRKISSQTRGYATQASEGIEIVGLDQESDFGTEENDVEAELTNADASEASQDIPSPTDNRDRRKLMPGDWVQVALYVKSSPSTRIY
jgi:hypothetical protein